MLFNTLIATVFDDEKITAKIHIFDEPRFASEHKHYDLKWQILSRNGIPSHNNMGKLL